MFFLSLYGAFLDLLHLVCNKGVKRMYIIVDVCLNDFVIGPEHLFYFILSELLFQRVANSGGHQGSCMFKVRYGDQL